MSDTLEQQHSLPLGTAALLRVAIREGIADKLIASFARAAAVVGVFACGDGSAKHTTYCILMQTFLAITVVVERRSQSTYA